MKLSTKCRYGARAMVEIARNYEKGLSTKRKDITANQGIPPSYLENILIDLRDKGLVTTIRGPKGGFSLTRSPEEISMLDVILALRGVDMLVVECLDKSFVCKRMASCVTRKVWLAMQKAQDDVLRSINLKSLALSEDSCFDKMDYVI